MQTTLKTDITIADICKGFVYNELEGKGLYGLSGKLTIQPEYQRNYIYADGKRDVAVIDSILKGDFKPQTYEREAVHDFLTSVDIPHNKIRQADSYAHVWDVELVGDCLQALEMDRLISNDFAEFFGVYYTCDHLFIQLRIKHPEAYIPEEEEENENTDDGLPF